MVAFGRHPHRGRWRSEDPDGPRAVSHAMAVTGVVDMAERVISLCRENESMRLMALVDQELRREQGPGHGPRPTAPH